MKIKINLPGLKERSIAVGGFEITASLFFISFAMGKAACLGEKRFAIGIISGVVVTYLLLYSVVRRVLLSRTGAFIICYIFVAACIWGRFTLSVSSYIWHDDAPMLYSFTRQGFDMLRQGGAFGWNSSLLGGYPAFLDKQYNLSMAAWPFMCVFGDLTGFNIFIFSAISIFPILAYCCTKAWFPGERTVHALSIYFSCMWLNIFFGRFINNCSFNSMVGLDCYVLVLLFIKRFADRGKLSAFFLALVIALTCYAHLSFFVLAGATFLFIVAIIPDRGRNIWRAGGVLLVAFMATLPYVWPFLNYRSYFIEDVQHFAPHIVHFSFPLLVQSVIDAAGRDLFSDFWGGLYFLPLACWMFIKCRFRGLRILLCAYFLLTVFVNTGMKFTDQAFARMIYGFSIYWVMFLSPIGSEEWCDSISFRSMVCGGLFFVIFATVWIDRPAFLTWTTPRARNIASYNPALIQKITTLTGNLILLENQGGLNHATETSLGKESERWSDDVHLVGVVALETGKNIFAADIDGFPPSVFRTNTITSGTYKGRFLSEHPAAEISALLKNWGIKYLVLWSNEARDYFKSQQGNYKLVWRIDPTELQKAGFEPVPWEIYEFANADPRSVVISPGSGLVETKDYFTKILRLYGVQRGAKVIIRTNYFPAWRAFWGNHEIKLINEGGQLALLCPSDGDQVVYLHFPKYKSLTVLAFLALLLCLPLSLRGYL